MGLTWLRGRPSVIEPKNLGQYLVLYEGVCVFVCVHVWVRRIEQKKWEKV